MERGVAVCNPQQGRQPPVSIDSRVLANAIQVVRDGQDAVGSDESLDLHPQREKRDQVDEADRTEEEPASDAVRSAPGRGGFVFP